MLKTRPVSAKYNPQLSLLEFKSVVIIKLLSVVSLAISVVFPVLVSPKLTVGLVFPIVKSPFNQAEFQRLVVLPKSHVSAPSS